MDDVESDGGRTLSEAPLRPLEADGPEPSADDVGMTIGQASSPRGPELTVPGAVTIGSESIRHDQTIAAPVSSAPSPAPRPLPTVPGYGIEAEVGRGGMGVVYRARQLRLNRIVALKMILAGDHAGVEAGARFLAEAEAIARLQHPNIVQIHHIDEHEGRPYFEMEYVGGGSLADQLDGRPRPPREAARLVSQLARGIAEAHRAGIVHRDLKPGNILIAGDGTPKVADFGLAKSIGVESGLTRTDSILGSPSYMAPEQAEGHAHGVEPSADVYALGAILYEQFTGRAPFVGSTIMETLRQVREAEPVSPSRLVPALPRDAETIVLKCLEKAPARRYATASELADDLERFVDGSPIVARPVAFWERGWKWAARRPAISVLLLALLTSSALLLGLGVLSYLRVQEALELARVERTRATVFGNQQSAFRVQAELDRALAESSRNEALAETYRASISEARALRAAHRPGWRDAALGNLTRLATLPTPRRDLVELRSEAVACLSEFDIREVARFQSPRGEAFGLDFLGDGRTLASAHRGGGVQLWDVMALEHAGTIDDPGGSLVPTLGWPASKDPWPAVRRRPDGPGLIYNDRGHGALSFALPAMLADRPPIDREKANSCGLSIDAAGRRLAVGWLDGRVDVLEAATGSPILSDTTAFPRGFALSPDGLRLALSGPDHSIRLQPVDGDGPALVLGRHRDPVRCMAFSPDGTTLATGSDDHTVMLWDVARGESRFPLLGHKQRVQSLTFSADSEWLATCGSDHTVRLWEARTGRELAVLEHPSFVVAAAFSPGGDYLATSCYYDPMIRLYRIAGRSERKKLIGHTTGLERLAFHPRRDRLASGEVNGQIILWDPTSGRMLRQWAGHGSHVNSLGFSSDGSRLASGGGGGDAVVHLWELETGSRTGSLPSHGTSVVSLAFDRSGRRVATGDLRGVVRLWDADSGALLNEIKLPAHASTVVFVDDDRRLLVQVAEGATWLLDLTGDEPPRSIATPGGGMTLTVDSARQRAIVGGVHGDLTAVSLPGLALAQRVEGVQQDTILILALSPDGSLIASGGEGRQVVLSDAATLETLVRFPPRIGRVKTLDFDATGARLAVGGIDSEATIWDLGLVRSELADAGLAWDRPAKGSGLAPRGESGSTDRPVIVAVGLDPAESAQAEEKLRSGLRTLRDGRPAEALASLHEAVDQYRRIGRAHLGDQRAAGRLANALGRLGGALDSAGRGAEAKAVTGEARAILEGLANPTPGELYDLARLYARLRASSGEESLAARALATLRRSIEAGVAVSREQVDADRDFDTIRDRPDFRSALLDLGFPRDPFASP